MPNYFRYFKRNNPHSRVTSQVHSAIIKEYNSYIRDNISKKGQSYKMPEQMGIVELRKKKTEIKIREDGTIQNSLPVNWKETNKLWRDNPEALEKRIKIKFVNKHSDGYTFKLCYLRSKANYKNKTIYRLRFNRQMKRQLSQSIFDNKIDAFVNTYRL